MKIKLDAFLQSVFYLYTTSEFMKCLHASFNSYPYVFSLCQNGKGKKCKKRLQMVRHLFPKVIQIEGWQRQISNIDLLTSNSHQKHDYCFLSFNNTLGVNYNQNLTDELKLCSKVIN